MNNLAEIDLKRLLKICVDPKDKLYEQGWREFDHRYGKQIKGKILSITKNTESANNIAQKVMFRLIANDFRALKNFRAKDSETAFKRFLCVIAQMTTFAKLKTDQDNETLDDTILISDDAPKNQNGTHEKLISSLRYSLHQTQRSPYRNERDIFVFALRMINGIKSKDVAKIPLLKMNEHNVNVVVDRLKKELTKNSDDLGNLRDHLRDS